jgi:hypothetical protein
MDNIPYLQNEIQFYEQVMLDLKLQYQRFEDLYKTP